MGDRVNLHPGPCLKCSMPWRIYYGEPNRRYECRNEHVFRHNNDGTITEIVYPDFTTDQIREAEVKLYRERKIDNLPDRHAALRVLRDEHDADAMWAHAEGVNP